MVSPRKFGRNSRVVFFSYVASTVYTNPSLRNDKVSCIQIAVLAATECLIVLSVVRISGIVSFPHADHLDSCSTFFRVDKWVGMFSIVVIDRNGTNSAYQSLLTWFSVLLALRTWALWRLSKVILISLGVLLAVRSILSQVCPIIWPLTQLSMMAQVWSILLAAVRK